VLINETSGNVAVAVTALESRLNKETKMIIEADRLTDLLRTSPESLMKERLKDSLHWGRIMEVEYTHY